MAELEIFLVAPPGLESALLAEVVQAGWSNAQAGPGGVTITGGWPDVWRANLQLRGATRVLVRLGAFRVFHLAQLDKRMRKFAWGDFLRPDVPVRVEVTCRKSKVYHAGAARQRVERALTEAAGLTLSDKAPIALKVRIEDDLCTISVDSSGESLHKRGHKGGVGKAPMRETLAALFLRECGYDGKQAVVDPMCGSGTFVIEAAEIAAGKIAGRARSFAFEQLVGFDAKAAEALRTGPETTATAPQCFGFDRNAGAIEMSSDNAVRAGVTEWTRFTQQAVTDLTPPDCAPGLVIVNPPYGARIGNKKMLYSLYGSLGKTLMEHFKGWRVGIVTTEGGLARATGLPLLPPSAPIPHGGLKVRLFCTDTL